MVQTNSHGIWIWLGKALLASVIAFIALTLFCMWYQNIPLYLLPSDGVTDETYTHNTRYCRAVEGFGYGTTNNEGYMNLYDYDGEPVDVLVMGSSHMEAIQVPLAYSTASQLDAMTDAAVYNIGITGHDFYTCAANMEAAVKKYLPTKCIVLEIWGIPDDNDNITAVLDHHFPEKPFHGGSLRRLLRSNQFLYLAYGQIKEMFENSIVTEDANEPMHDTDPALLSALLSRMAGTAASSGARLVIAHHPGTTLSKDGSITFSTTEAEEDVFAALCEENDILFLNMRERFQREYDENHILPYGFSNTSVGKGHLNRYGHRMMAEELYALMQEEGL